MATIDTLWDEPIESEPAPHLAKNPVTPSEDPLFLQSDSDNELGGRTDAAGSRPSKAPEDIGALFDVDDDEENGQLSNVTYEQLRKDALSGGKVADDGSSSGGAEDAHSKGPSTDKFKADKKDEDGNAASTKRKIPKLDEELLLSEKGIPALIKDAKRWQPKGKGHEISDLNRLIRMYQYWAHRMYPRHTFNDTIERVERLTHSRRMHVALSVWHDEARGISRHQDPLGESIDIDEEEDQAGPSDFRQTSAPPTRPPSSASERTSGPDDDSNMDGDPGPASNGRGGGEGEFDFEVEMWDDIPFLDGPESAHANPTDPITDFSKPSTKLPPTFSNQDEDQDMWDILDGLQAQAKPNEDPNPSKGPPVPADDDWDSMYA